MDARLSSIGYEFETSKYSPDFGYSRLRAIITDNSNQRFFNIKFFHVPTFDGRSYHQTHISRHELAPVESFQVCMGELSLETFQGESILAFSFGGNLHTNVQMDELYCEFTSNAQIFMMEAESQSVSGVIADEIEDLLAENETTLAGHENELYQRLSKYDAYAIFLSSLVSLKKRADGVPLAVRRERYNLVSANIHRAIQIVREKDGWDGNSPSLEELLAKGQINESS